MTPLEKALLAKACSDFAKAAWPLRGQDLRFGAVAIAAEEDASRLIREAKQELRG